LIRARYASPRYEREPTQSSLGQDPMNSSCDVESPLPDLTDADLTKLLSSNDSVLQQALQRVREQSSTGEQIVAGFNSVI
jgi:FXSXX-COOH protein